MAYHVPHKFRVQDPKIPFLQNAQTMPTEGAFLLPPKFSNRQLFTIASCGGDWEHVSISVRQGKKVLTPTWEECCYVKDIFWDEDDCVMQLHPPKSDYVNQHPNVLHLWRPANLSIPRPPAIFVGVKDMKNPTQEEVEAVLSHLSEPEKQILLALQTGDKNNGQF